MTTTSAVVGGKVDQAPVGAWQGTATISDVKTKLDSLFSKVGEIKPPYGHGKTESWWVVIQGSNIFEAKQKAGTYALGRQAFDETTFKVKETMLQAAMETGRISLMLDAIYQAYETVWTRTKMANYGYDETIALKAMATVVEDLDFAGKQQCLDLAEERMRAVENGVIPYSSIGAELVVYKSGPSLRV